MPLLDKSSKIVCLFNHHMIGLWAYSNTDDAELKHTILTEAHSSPFAMHPGSTKMYRDLKDEYYWVGLKKDVAEFVSKFMVCQRAKVEHQVPFGLLQPLRIA
ncbi:hypothetical protein HRI_004111000 [Hibiscus trionum]|uniref:Integrase zinc-binding domain-containing protein n=1 Tax=Hibiscus trionum TaxID=183268 RepID=A0A9W7MHE8_HIBTR|nr:hypothetical protein HRI_004111000 [Hibiscus trionum]